MKERPKMRITFLLTAVIAAQSPLAFSMGVGAGKGPAKAASAATPASAPASAPAQPGVWKATSETSDKMIIVDFRDAAGKEHSLVCKGDACAWSKAETFTPTLLAKDGHAMRMVLVSRAYPAKGENELIADMTGSSDAGARKQFATGPEYKALRQLDKVLSAKPAAGAVLVAAATPDPKLPKWATTEEPWGAWRIVNFTDDKGVGQERWCRWSECSREKTSGTAPLYILTRGASEQYELDEPLENRDARAESQHSSTIARWWAYGVNRLTSGENVHSAKTTYATVLSQYQIDMSSNPHHAVVPGTNWAFPVEDRAQLTPLGYMLIVNAPTSVAKDAPKGKGPAQKKAAAAVTKAAPAAAAAPAPAAGGSPATAATPAATTGGPAPAAAPQAARKSKLSQDELDALTKAERATYDALGSDDARADFVAKIQPKVTERLAMKGLPQTAAELKALTPAQREKVCDMLSAPAVNAAPTEVTGAQKQLRTAAESEAAAKGILAGDVHDSAPVKAVPRTDPVKTAEEKTKAEMRKVCDEMKVADAKSLKNGEVPGLNKSTQPKEEKADPAFYKNLANGTAAGMFGLLLGSFFGGPLVMFAAAAALGGGAYFLSEKLNKKDK